MKKLIAVLLVLTMAFLLVSCDGSDTDETTEPEDYVLPTQIIDADISLPYMSSDSFDPYKAKSTFNRDLIPVIYESLFTPTNDGKGKPLLAVSGEIDGKTVTVKIISNAKFSDGTVIEPSHIKYSFEKAKANSFYKASLSNFSSVTVKGENTLIFTLYNPDALALNVLDFPITKNNGKGHTGSGTYSVAYLDKIPYLQVNTNHRDFQKSWNNQIALYDMAGITSPVYPFKANEISVYKQSLSTDAYINLSSTTVSENMNNLVYVGANSNWSGSITSLDWVRQAINIGISRSSVVASSFLGQGTAVVTPFRNEFYQLNTENLPDLSGETERAISILERNGYTKIGDDGVRNNGSSSLRLNILVCSENQYKLTVAEAVKKSLEELGFGVSITEKKTAEDFAEALNEGHYSLYIGETKLSGNVDLSSFFSADGTLNYGIDEEFFAVYADYKNGSSTTMSFVEAFATEVPFIPLYYRKTVVCVNPNIKGASDGYNCYDGICGWTVSEK